MDNSGSCTYCGARIKSQPNPVYISEDVDDSVERTAVFCEYTCLVAFINKHADELLKQDSGSVTA